MISLIYAIPSLSTLDALERKDAVKFLFSQQIPQKERLRIDIHKYIGQFLKPGRSINDLPLDKLGIETLDEKNKSKLKKGLNGYYLLDARYFIAITYQMTPNKKRKYSYSKYAIAAIGFNTEGRTLIVKQIQGHKIDESLGQYAQAVKEILSAFRWEKLLVALLENWAKSSGFELVMIRKAEFNRYYSKIREYKYMGTEEAERCRLRNERLRMHYNVTAKRMRYTENGEYFLKVLQS